MHINLTPRFVVYTVTTTLVFMLLFYAGTAPDVMKSTRARTGKSRPGSKRSAAYAAGEVARRTPTVLVTAKSRATATMPDMPRTAAVTSFASR